MDESRIESENLPFGLHDEIFERDSAVDFTKKLPLQKKRTISSEEESPFQNKRPFIFILISLLDLNGMENVDEFKEKFSAMCGMC